MSFVEPLNDTVIHDVIGVFEGTHDFSYFKKSGSSATSFVRTVYKARFYRYRGYGIFYFEANSFVRSQIRLMVGFLLKISQGKLSQKELVEQLNVEKQHASRVAEPYGLYLSRVRY